MEPFCPVLRFFAQCSRNMYVPCTRSIHDVLTPCISQAGDVKAVELLLRVSGCLETLRLADHEGNLPPHIACQCKHADVVRALLREDPSVIETANRCVQLFVQDSAENVHTTHVV